MNKLAYSIQAFGILTVLVIASPVVLAASAIAKAGDNAANTFFNGPSPKK